MKKIIYLCYQTSAEATIAEGYNTNILGICDSEKRAQEICNHNGDCYSGFELNKDLGRIPESPNDKAIYNVNGKFIKGYENAKKEIGI